MDLYDLWFVFIEEMEAHAEDVTGSADEKEWLQALPEADGDFLVLAGFMGKYSNCGSFTDSARSWREHHEPLARALVWSGYPSEASMLGMAADLEDQLREEDEPGPELVKACEAMEDSCSIRAEDIMEKILADPGRFSVDPRELIEEPLTGGATPSELT